MHYPYEVGRRFTRPDSDSSADPSRSVRMRSPAPAVSPDTAAVHSAEILRSRLQSGHALAPLYRAVLAWPGLHVGPDQFDAAFGDLTRLFQRTVELIQRQLQESQAEPIAATMLARPVAELAGCAWALAHEESADPEAMSAQRLARIYLQTLDVFDSTPDRRRQPLSPDEQLQLAEAQAVTSAMLGLLQVWVLRPATQRLYVGERTPAQTMAHVRASVLESANDATNRLAAQRADHQRAVVYRSVLGVMSDLYRSTLEAQFHELSREIRRMDPAQQSAYLQSLHEHPDGMLIGRTEQVFREVSAQCYPERLHLQIGPQPLADVAEPGFGVPGAAGVEHSLDLGLRTDSRDRRAELSHE